MEDYYANLPKYSIGLIGDSFAEGWGVNLKNIFPTILDLVGINDSIQGQNGQSLVPLMNGKKIEEKPAYIEVGINLAQLIDQKNPQVEL